MEKPSISRECGGLQYSIQVASCLRNWDKLQLSRIVQLFRHFLTHYQKYIYVIRYIPIIGMYLIT